MSTSISKKEPGALRGRFRPGLIDELRAELHDLFSSPFEEEPATGFERFVPSLDLAESDDALEVRMDIPGVEAKDIDIRVHGNLLTVSGKQSEQREETGKTFHRVERRVGTFFRSVEFPRQIQEDAIDAQYKNGILTIRLPKTDEAKSSRIPVKG
jgi:HSP20 family protein